MFEITINPSLEIYKNLLTFCFQNTTKFSLVWRDEHFPFLPSAHQIRQSLAPFLIEKIHTSTWGSTRLIGHKAWVHYYHTHTDAKIILEDIPSLFEWLSPHYPEDICFYRIGLEPWFESYSRDNTAIILDPNIDEKNLKNSIPNLQFKTIRIS